MPRSGRGGQRQGTPGQAYANRTDLQSDQPVAVQTAPGQSYGQRAAQTAAQQQIPLAPPPGPSAPGAGVPAPGGPPTPQPGAGQALAGPQPLKATSPEPGELSWTGPSERPNEPITHGLPIGAGGGPEVLSGIGALANRQNPQDTATKLLATLALSPTAGSQIQDLARLAMATGR